jgi:hypothetical protein
MRGLRRALACAAVLMSGCLSVTQQEGHRTASVGVGPGGVSVQEDECKQERAWHGPCFVRPDGR